MSESEVTSPLQDARPMVAGTSGKRGVWVFAGVAGLAAVTLFGVLEARRAARLDSALLPVQTSGDGAILPPPPLAVPEQIVASAPSVGAAAWPVPSYTPSPAYVPPPQPPSRGVKRTDAPIQVQPYYAPPAAVAPPAVGPAMVYQAQPSPLSVLAEVPGKEGARVKAGRFANPSVTVPQGAVIQAVLETAVDSTRPGPARAIVSRDVRSFDGSRVLIPRGSRLYGEYKADLAGGQNRAMIQWTRLMRPDGVVIALDSPSADPLGRAGVKGKVNTHFFSRFGNALLQTMLNVGVSYGTSQASGGTVIVGLPGNSIPPVAPQAEQVRPTLKVEQGTPVSVFVARDLDFGEVER